MHKLEESLSRLIERLAAAQGSQISPDDLKNAIGGADEPT
jgi:hypothetical protein